MFCFCCSSLTFPYLSIRWVDNGAGGAERCAEWRLGLDMETALNALLASFGTQSPPTPLSEAAKQGKGVKCTQPFALRARL